MGIPSRELFLDYSRICIFTRTLFRRYTVNVKPFQPAVQLKGRTSMVFLSQLPMHRLEAQQPEGKSRTYCSTFTGLLPSNNYSTSLGQQLELSPSNT